MAWNQPGYRSKKNAQPKRRGVRGALVVIVASLSLVLVVVAVWHLNGGYDETQSDYEAKRRKIADAGRSYERNQSNPQICKEVDASPVVEDANEAPKTNQWGNPAHWGHKKLRPVMVHEIDRSQMPLFEQIFLNSADKTIAGLLVIEPGTDLIGDDTFDESFVKAFLKSIEQPIIVTKDDDEETKALKRAVIETKIELKSRLDAGEDIAKTLTDIRRELRELGAYRQEIKSLIDEKSRSHAVTTQDMRDLVEAANVMLEERGAKPIVMPEFYYHKLEIRNQKIKALKGE